MVRNGNNLAAYQDLNINLSQVTDQGYIGIWNAYSNYLSIGSGLFQGVPIAYCPMEIAKFYIYGTDYSNQQIKNHYNVYKSKFNIS
jgi:hypothetical protein